MPKPVKPHVCAQQGHCWHEADGTAFIRHSGRDAQSTVAVHCCYCPETATQPGFSNRPKPGPDAFGSVHGPGVLAA
jgi:hypothetical protein